MARSQRPSRGPWRGAPMSFRATAEIALQPNPCDHAGTPSTADRRPPLPPPCPELPLPVRVPSAPWPGSQPGRCCWAAYRHPGPLAAAAAGNSLLQVRTLEGGNSAPSAADVTRGALDGQFTAGASRGSVPDSRHPLGPAAGQASHRGRRDSGDQGRVRPRSSSRAVSPECCRGCSPGGRRCLPRGEP